MTHQKEVITLHLEEDLWDRKQMEIYYKNLLSQVNLFIWLSEYDKVGQTQFLLHQWSKELDLL